MLGRIVVICVGFLPVFCGAQAPVDSPLQVGLGTPFLDNAVLQQQLPLPIWGTAEAEAKVTVVFKGQSKSTTAQKDGSWRVVLEMLGNCFFTQRGGYPEGPVGGRGKGGFDNPRVVISSVKSEADGIVVTLRSLSDQPETVNITRADGRKTAVPLLPQGVSAVTLNK